MVFLHSFGFIPFKVKNISREMRGKPKLIGSPLFWRLSIRKSTVNPAPEFSTAHEPDAPGSLRGNCDFSQAASSFVETVFPTRFPFAFIGAVFAGSLILTASGSPKLSACRALRPFVSDPRESKAPESPTRFPESR